MWFSFIIFSLKDDLRFLCLFSLSKLDLSLFYYSLYKQGLEQVVLISFFLLKKFLSYSFLLFIVLFLAWNAKNSVTARALLCLLQLYILTCHNLIDRVACWHFYKDVPFQKCFKKSSQQTRIFSPSQFQTAHVYYSSSCSVFILD